MTSEQFVKCTYREFALKMDGYNIKRSHEFENTRSICYYILATNWDTSKRALPTMHEFWPLITDEQELEEEKTIKDAEYQHLKEIMRLAELNKFPN